MTQYAYFFDQSRCTGCQTCTLACKSQHDLPPGPLKYLKIYEYEKGTFADVRMHIQWVPCYHCERPACVEICPTGAMYKEEKYGAVLIEQEDCVGCRSCYGACPYGAPVFESDEEGREARKCDMCIKRLEQGDLPICVLSCKPRALDFGPIETMRAKYGNNSRLEDMPDENITKPSLIVKPHAEKKKLIPYDSSRALELLARRDPLPELFTKPEDVLEIPEGIVARNKLVLKHDTVDDLMQWTRNDEG